MGLTLGALSGEVFSQTTTCRFEALQLSFKNVCKLWPLLQRWVEEADNDENLQEVCKAETLVQARERKRTSIENRVRGNLESMLLQCPKPTPQQISHIAQQLGLEKDVVRACFCNRRQKGKRSSSDCSQREDLEAAGSPCSGGPVSFPLAPGRTLVPRAAGALTSPHCAPRSHSLRVRPFPRCLSPLWALPCIQTEVPTLPRNGVEGRGRGVLGREPWGLYQGFGIKFFSH